MSLITDAQHTMHRLSQFLAGFGNSFLTHRDDDGQVSLEWVNDQLWSEKANGVKMGLDYKNGKILLNGSSLKKEIHTEDKTMTILYNEIKELLDKNTDLEGQYKLEFNYDLDFDLWEESAIVFPMDNVLQLLIHWRIIGQSVLENLNDIGEGRSQVRVWPHHFDTGKLIGKDKDFREGFGLGYAIPDKVSPSPYFYLYEWPKRDMDYSNFSSRLRGVKWLDKKSWKGSILAVSSNITQQQVEDFYREGMDKLGVN
jgi:hypothetical protein